MQTHEKKIEPGMLLVIANRVMQSIVSLPIAAENVFPA
jgi:hypothetical protein